MMSKLREGYKQSKVGVIPEEWEVVEFNDLRDINVSHSITGGPFGSNLKSEHYTDTGVRIIQLQNIGDGSFINKDFIYTDEEKARELKSCLIYPNDIILAKMAEPVSRACIIPSFEDKFLMGSDGIRLHIDKEKYDNKFILESINYRQFRNIAIARSTGSTRQRIGLTDLKKIPIIIPPLKEQQKIAQILSTWDSAISKQEVLIKAKEQLKKGLMQKLLSGEVRFEGFDGEWEEVRLGDVGYTYGGLTKKTAEDFGCGDANYITYKNIFDNDKIDVSIFDNVEIGNNEKQNKVIYGDVLFTTSSETPEEVGMSSVLLDEIDELYLNSFCFGYRLNDLNIINPQFARFYFRSFYMRDKISRLAQGSTRFNLSKLQVMKIKISIPLLKEQKKIAQVLSTADKEIELLKNELETLKEQKRGLMQRLLSGDVRVVV